MNRKEAFEVVRHGPRNDMGNPLISALYDVQDKLQKAGDQESADIVAASRLANKFALRMTGLLHEAHMLGAFLEFMEREHPNELSAWTFLELDYGSDE